jgi:hypothetical protein
MADYRAGRPSRARSRIHLDVWTTDDTSRFDSEEAINPATCSNRPIVNGVRELSSNATRSSLMPISHIMST